MEVSTGDLCNGNPGAANELEVDGGWGENVEFKPECASCVSRVAILGSGKCYENTFTFRTHCQCTTLEFNECACWRSLNIMVTLFYIGAPFFTMGLLFILCVCQNCAFCPMGKMTAKYAEMQKKGKKSDKKSVKKSAKKKGKDSYKKKKKTKTKTK